MKILQAQMNLTEFFEMDLLNLMFISVLYLFILYQIIRYATGKDKILKNQKEMIRLLKKQVGEPEEEQEETLENMDYDEELKKK